MIVVVGGQSRNVGKTSIAAGLIAALPELQWTAVKITQFGHGVCARDGEACDCQPADPTHDYTLTEEYEPGDTDSARFLAAGARRAFWLRTAAGQLARAARPIHKLIANHPNVMFESNSVLDLIEPDLYIVALDPACSDFKTSAARFLDRADAFVVSNAGAPIAEHGGRPAFAAGARSYVSQPLVDFVRIRYLSVAARSSVSVNS
jgi:hypothetical protein